MRVKHIEITRENLQELSNGMYLYTMPAEETENIGTTNFSLSMELEARQKNKVISIGCNGIVRNKVIKFFNLARRHNIEVLDIEITEFAHPAWLPETAGTYGGEFRVIVKDPGDEFLLEARRRLPMLRSWETTVNTF